MKKAIFILYFFLTFKCYATQDELYVFDVGQGNAQLAIFGKTKIGLLYDAGTSSSRKHPKISELLRDNDWEFFFRKRTLEKEKIEQKIPPKKNIDFLKFTKRLPQISPSQSSDEISIEDSISGMEDLNVSIRNIIAKENLRHLFVVLSHPDKDHISLVRENIFPEEIPVTVFLEGHWFGKIKDKDDSLSGLIINTMNFLKKRKNTWVELPFYWGGFSTLSHDYNYQSLKDSWARDDENFSETFEILNNGVINNSVVCLNLFHTLDRMHTLNSNSSTDLEKHLKNIKMSFDTNDYYPMSISDDSETLKNVKIAHIGYPFSDVNSQSAIVEVKIPSLKMQFFLTGDAKEETFSLIKDYNFFKKEEDFLSIVMLPHHGSIKNKSINMYHMFKPDIFGISAGNGATFAHPSKDLIKKTIKDLQKTEWKTKFYDLFEPFGVPNNLIYFEKKTSKEKNKKKEIKASLFKNITKKDNDLTYRMPFFSTNLLGSIKIDSSGFKTLFTNIIQEGETENYFLLDYRKKIDDEELINKLDNAYVDENGIVEDEEYDETYYKIQNDKGGNFYYSLKAISKDLVEVGGAQKKSRKLDEYTGKISKIIVEDILEGLKNIKKDAISEAKKVLEEKGLDVSKKDLKKISGIGKTSITTIFENIEKIKENYQQSNRKKPINTVGGLKESYQIDGQNFRRQNVSGEGMRCFFNALGISPKDAINKLLKNSNIQIVREMIGNEIVSSIEDPNQIPETVKEIINYDDFIIQKEAIDDLREQRNKELLKQSPDEENQDVNQLPEELKNLDEKYADLIKELRKKASTILAFKAFIQDHIEAEEMMVALHDVKGDIGDIIEEDNSNYTSIDAVAYTQNVGIKIFQVDDTSGKLTLVHEFIPQNTQEIYYLYHAGIHFQALVKS